MIVYPLNATQEDMLRECDMETLETSFCIFIGLEIPNNHCSCSELINACQKVLDTNHYTHVHLVKQGDKLMISEDTDMPNRVEQLVMSDKEWNEKKHLFAKPFRILEEPGVRVTIISTESKSIMCTGFNHLFFDGISIKGYFNQIEDALAGIPIEDQSDIVAQWNREEIASYSSEEYQRAKQMVCDKFRGRKYTDICRQTDNPVGKLLYSCYLLDYDRMKHIRKNSSALSEEQQNRMMTTICVAAYAMALGQMAGTDEVVFMTTNHGRIDKRLNAKVLGNFLKSMSLRVNVDAEQSVAELLSQTRTALFGMMRSIKYPWLHHMRDLNVPLEEQVGTEMNVSGSGIYEYICVRGVDYPSYHIEVSESAMHLFLVVQIREEGLTFNVEGSEALYSQEQLDSMGRLTGEYVLQLIGDQSKKLKSFKIDV